MKNMLGALKKYSALYVRIMAQNLKTMMEYRADFLMMLFFTVLAQFSGLFFIYVVYRKVPDIAGWTFMEIFFLYGLIFFTEGIINFLFEGTWLINGLINRGELDRFILRPMPVGMQVLTMKVNFDGLGKIIVSAAILSRSLSGLNLSWDLKTIIVFFLLIVSASVIRVSMNMTANSLSFWIQGARSSVPHLVHTISELGKYPVNIFSRAIQFFLVFIVPYAFIGFFPASYLLNKSKFAMAALLTPLVAVIWIFIAKTVFKAGLRRYESTGN